MTSLPNELLMRIIQLTDEQDLTEYLFVCKYTFHLVRQRVYKKVIFPDTQVTESDVISFFKLYANSIETVKLPQCHEFSTLVYEYILIHCPRLDFLQSSIYPKQLNRLKYLMRSSTCFMITEIPVDLITHHDLDTFHSSVQTTTYFPCCPSFFIFPSELIPEKNSPLTQISHYFHHPGALSNAILPTFGSDLIALTLNPYDVLTASVARLIVAKCPRLRYLVVPSVKAEGLWMLLRWCHTLAAIVVGDDNSGMINEEEEEEEEEEQDHTRRLFIEIENQRSVETIQNHKRVWCVHSSFLNTVEKRTSWHIGIIPRL
ncbi:hypothetical protein EDC94DRAFT_654977 [Helicostylum pulchrum]|uniref:F-box domain-containing protein n=1 Tax=Helicostylum pulchrum TaxID=562976 RepID=A0ABP9XVQ0_9FUNG|nr:hypothetical protein EDC94DRAFT_654977 [Helicostylum pulchrum]